MNIIILVFTIIIFFYLLLDTSCIQSTVNKEHELHGVGWPVSCLLGLQLTVTYTVTEPIYCCDSSEMLIDF